LSESGDNRRLSFLERIEGLEKRVTELKETIERKIEAHIKKKDADVKERDAEIERLSERLRVTDTDKFRQALREFIGVDFSQGPTSGKTAIMKMAMDLVDQELAVTVTHEEKTVNISTTSHPGKIMFLALTELNREGWSERELSEALAEHGWQIPHGSLSARFTELTQLGWLIRIKDGQSTRYRLPTKVSFKQEDANG
jgi:hypothetical protein